MRKGSARFRLLSANPVVKFLVVRPQIGTEMGTVRGDAGIGTITLFGLCACPLCGGPMVPREGCESCASCGFSRCGD